MKITKHPLMLRGPVPPGLPVDAAVVRKLESSFEVLAAHAEAFTKSFYDRLFAQHPQLRPMFKTDPAIQRAKLFESLRQVVHHLKQPELQSKELAALGQRHVAYGTKPEHYPVVCKLMSESMAEACGNAWNPDLTAEWYQALQLISYAMLAGAYPPKEAGPPLTTMSAPRPNQAAGGTSSILHPHPPHPQHPRPPESGHQSGGSESSA
jgi:methyl-accepting chemotaxis protein